MSQSGLSSSFESKQSGVRRGLTVHLLGFLILLATTAHAQNRDDPQGRLVQIGPGDSVDIRVFGQPDMNVTVYVSDDGTLPVPLAGPVKVAGLSPSEAADRIEVALRDGKFLVNPDVSLIVSNSRSQRVSVLGEVGNPGRYVIESNTPIYVVLAEAGGTTANSADYIYILRPGSDGIVTRREVSLKGLEAGGGVVPTATLQGGDSIVVPKAEMYYIYGQVQQPNNYKIAPRLTVEEALVKAGGLTPIGSRRRIELKRLDPVTGKTLVKSAKLSDRVLANDVILVKESIF